MEMIDTIVSITAMAVIGVVATGLGAIAVVLAINAIKGR